MPRMRRQSPRVLAGLEQQRRDANRAAQQVSPFDRVVNEFERDMRNLVLQPCAGCQEIFWNTEDINANGCRSCRGGNNLYTAENGMDFGEVPEELRNLTLIEQLLIARIHPVVSVFKIRGCQTGYSGHTMNFVQRIEDIATRLPHNIGALTSVVLMNQSTPHGLVQFRVRSGVVRRALTWLKTHNQYYSDIIIDEQVLMDLPEDGDVVDRLPTQPPEEGAVEAPIDPNEQHNDIIDASCFPNLPALDAASAIDRNLNRIARGNFDEDNLDEADWPDRSQNRLNEFNTEGIICKAFPCLFPYGRGDLNAPRLRQVKRRDYFKHLMDYRDGRFANDIRFPYYAYNTLARHDALNAGNVYVRQHNMDNLTNEDLRRMMDDPDNNLADRIMYHGTNLRGTRVYWKQRSAELTQMCLQLGKPTIFFTLSAADYHWPDLFRLLSPNVDPSTLTERDRHRLMHENPMTVAKFFDKRCEIFCRKVFEQLFQVQDFWYRYEWQHRGSPHIHGVLWLPEAPDCSVIDPQNQEIMNRIVEYFDRYVSAEIGQRYDDGAPANNPCRTRYTDLTAEQRERDLDRLLSAVQRHSRHGPHCMRKKRGTRILECRYKFPRPIRDSGGLVFEDGSWRFEPKRNDEHIQRFNKFVTQIWRGNTDFSAIISKDALLKYIAKYASKCEHGSEAYSDILRRFMVSNENDAPAATLIRQLLISSVAERNYSAQEVMHLLMGWPLYHASRGFQILNLNEQWQRLGGEASEANVARAYATRRGLEELTLFEFARDYRVTGRQYTLRRKSFIVRVIPFLKLTDDYDANEEYYKQQCKLHIPWRGSVDTIRPQNFDWAQLHLVNIEDIQRRVGDFAVELPPPDEVEYEDNPLDHAQIVRDAGLAAARLHPRLDALDPLGHRPIDEAYQWSTSTSSGITQEEIDRFFVGYRTAAVQVRDRGNSIPFERMSTAQQQVLLLCRQSLYDDSIKRVLVQGKAGTGKSAVIKAMCQVLDNASPDNKTYEVLAPTGAAALNVDGKTIHSFLQIPTQGTMSDLNGESLRNFQLKFQHIKHLIFDEYSMIGRRMLTKIHHRLLQARERREGVQDQPFGGFNIWFFGDLRQLPPVMDRPIYLPPTDDYSRISINLVESIQRKILLTTCHRQDLDQEQFKQTLDSIATGTVTQQGWQLLMTRRMAVISEREQRTFADAIELLPTNKEVDEQNISVLRSNGQPVATFLADHNNISARHGNDSDAQGLSPELNLSINCRIMLRKNLDVARGLVNGSLGTVRDIIFKDDERPPALPLALLVEWDNYNGPRIANNVYPLLPVTARWKERGVDCTRKQFPINLAYALTIHKSQGLTLEKVKVDIGPKETSVGLTYVALSRVKRLNDLLLRNPFDFTRLTRIGTMVGDRERFMEQMNIA